MIRIICNDQIVLNKKKLTMLQINKKIFKKTYIFFIFANVNYISADIHSNISLNSAIDFIKNTSYKSLNVLRHSCAHLMAHAITLIYKDVKFAVGPVIKNGFYYDFFYNKKLSLSDLKFIENKMNELVKKEIEVEKKNLSKKDVMSLFKSNKYKIDIIEKISLFNQISVYKQFDFQDLCKGPHVYNLKFIRYFKLVKISGAYWKNNNKNEMLYRIYGTAWENKKNLYNYILKLNNLAESDHRIIGKKLNLFDMYDHSPGVVFWNKNGWSIFLSIKTYIRNTLEKSSYLEVNTPIMNGDFLFKKSGHIEKFIENMFLYSCNSNLNVLKPMSCPCHINIFNNFYKKSYKNLPFRISEFGSCFRKELSGALHGLMRLKNFTQDDGHIFCTDYQIENEIIKFIHSLRKVYYNFGFKKFKVVLSKKPKEILSDILIWERAEKKLEDVIKKMNMNYSISNDGAFYGPKLEFSLRDNFDRLWQCGTIQVDFFTGIKLNAKYTEYNESLIHPIILHRAILGSIERFVGILLENSNGYIPFFISPIQFEIIYINIKYLFYAKNIYNIVKNKYNVRICFSNERLEYKLKQSILQKVIYTIIIGEKEYANKSITLRDNKFNTTLKLTLIDFFAKFKV